MATVTIKDAKVEVSQAEPESTEWTYVVLKTKDGEVFMAISVHKNNAMSMTEEGEFVIEQ